MDSCSVQRANVASLAGEGESVCARMTEGSLEATVT